MSKTELIHVLVLFLSGLKGTPFFISVQDKGCVKVRESQSKRPVGVHLRGKESRSW